MTSEPIKRVSTPVIRVHKLGKFRSFRVPETSPFGHAFDNFYAGTLKKRTRGNREQSTRFIIFPDVDIDPNHLNPERWKAEPVDNPQGRLVKHVRETLDGEPILINGKPAALYVKMLDPRPVPFGIRPLAQPGETPIPEMPNPVERDREYEFLKEARMLRAFEENGFLAERVIAVARHANGRRTIITQDIDTREPPTEPVKPMDLEHAVAKVGAQAAKLGFTEKGRADLKRNIKRDAYGRWHPFDFFDWIYAQTHPRAKFQQYSPETDRPSSG